MLHRLVYRPDGERIPFPTHLFFFITLGFGLAFVLPPGVFGLGVIELFKFSHLHGIATYWGWAMVATSVMNTITLLTKSGWLGQITGALGFACWMYAAIAYVIGGPLFGLMVGAGPNMAFWAWYSYRLGMWHRYARAENE